MCECMCVYLWHHAADTGSRWKPSYVIDGTVGVSKTFQILYRKEDVELYDIFTFKVYMIVDVNKVLSTNSKLPVT